MKSSNRDYVKQLYQDMINNIQSGTIKSEEHSIIYELDEKYMDDLTQSIHLCENKINSILPMVTSKYFNEINEYYD